MVDRGETVKGVHWEVAGSGPAVVLSHDGALHSEAWDAQFEAWPASGYRVARWDRRGYGRSPRAIAAFSSVDDLAALVKETGAPAALVGCSFGGLVSLQCALDHPELVASLVLVGPIVSGLPLSDHFNTRGGRRVPGPGAPAEERIEYISERDPWFIAPDNVTARARLKELLTANPQNLNSGSSWSGYRRCRGEAGRHAGERASATPGGAGGVQPDRPRVPGADIIPGMYVRVDESGVALVDVTNFRAFSVAVHGDRDLGTALDGVGVVDGEHAFLDVGEVKRLAGEQTPEWGAEFDKMIEFARSKGWVDEAGRVRAHIERR